MKVDEMFIDFNTFQDRVIKIAKQIKRNKKIKDIFGIPRGGLIPAVYLSHLTKKPITANPKAGETAIIDDVIDSGSMRHSFSHFKYFYAVVNKQKERMRKWVVFWWEVDNENKKISKK